MTNGYYCCANCKYYRCNDAAFCTYDNTETSPGAYCPMWEGEAMSRREEVVNRIDSLATEVYSMCLTLADEVDARDRIITELLAMLKPKHPCPKHEDFVPFDYNKWNDATCAWIRVDDLYQRACKIAGRTE